MTDSLCPHGLQHTKLPHPSLSPGVCSNSRPLRQWCHPTISSSVAVFFSCPQSFPTLGSFSSKLALHIRWYFSFSISPSKKYSGLISFRIDLLAAQGMLKSLLQHHNSKASILLRSAFFLVQLSYPYKQKLLSPVWLSVTPWTVARQAPLSTEFSRQEN